jgi:hypothetical protein
LSAVEAKTLPGSLPLCEGRTGFGLLSMKSSGSDRTLDRSALTFCGGGDLSKSYERGSGAIGGLSTGV